jgi:hypothetical protein
VDKVRLFVQNFNLGDSMAIHILPLQHLCQAEADRNITGYASNQRYTAARLQSEAQTTISLTLEDLPQPYHKQFNTGSETLAMYNQVLELGFSLGAYQRENLVALAVAEPRRWNRSLWVWEFNGESFEVAIFMKRRLE